MSLANRDAAVAALGKLNLTGGNAELARYWLSLWEGDRLPSRSAFNPAKIKSLLPGIGLFDVRPGESVRCRLAGGIIQTVINHPLTGADWRSYTPKDQWEQRLHRNSQIASGAVGIGIRHGTDTSGPIRAIELQLPFGDVSEDGARMMLFHLDWKPGVYESYRTRGESAAAIADEYVAIGLTDG